MSSDEGDGVASYQGYEYQILATVWLGLELMIRPYDCQSIVVEPASGEDVAAELKVPPEMAVSNVTVNVTKQPIEVQIKLRRTDQWTPSQFKEVMRGGAAVPYSGTAGTRARPIQQLVAHPTARFVLLTNAQVNRDLRAFLVDRLGEDSSADQIPGEAVAGETEQTAKRAGIMQQLHPELLQARIDVLLQQAGVPYAERHACAVSLQEEVRARLLRKKPPQLSRDEINNILRAFGGLPPQEPGEFLVVPQNFGDLSRQLEHEHRLSIVGPPGMGKTLVARELARHHRGAREPFQIITEKAGPTVIDECLEQPGRQLFFLEDPWGQFKLSADADRWVTALPKLLARASTDKRFLITSRTAIQNTAFASRLPHELVAAQGMLNETHYSAADRQQILERALASAAPWQRDFVQQHRDQILRSLNAPYSITLFATMLQRAPTEQEAHLDKLIHDSNVEAIGATVAAELQAMGRDTVASTIALWAWIMPQGKMNLQNADSLRRTVRDGGWDREIDIRKLLVFLAQSHWFREQEGEYVAHPSILEGLELVVTEEPGLAEEILTALLEGLARQNRGDLAHRIRKGLSGRQLPIPTRVQEAIDAHLLSSLQEASGYDFPQAFADVAADCRSSHPLAILARSLHVTRSRRGFMDYATWKPPELSHDEIEKIKAAPESREVAGKFVREILSSDSAQSFHATDLQGFFAQFGWNLAADFLTAVEAGLQNDNLYVDAAVEGALSGSEPPYDSVIEAALRHHDSTGQWWEGFQETYREARQAEIDADHANHIEEQPQERFAPSEAVLKAVVALRIHQQGYTWLSQHSRRDDLLDAWAESVTPSTSLEELTAITEVCRPQRLNVFYNAAEKSKNKEIVPAVMQALLVAGDSASQGWRVAMLALPAEELATLITTNASGLSFVRRLELADALAAAHLHDLENADQKKTQVIDALLNASEHMAWEATRPSQLSLNQLPPQDTDFIRASLQAIAGTTSSDILAVRAAFRLAKCGENVDEYLPRLLAAEEPEVRVNALRILGGRNDAASRAQLAVALTNKDYRCRREAMTWLASESSPTEQSAVLALARDRSAPVRERCAHLIAHYEWDHAQPVLFELLKDRRSLQHGGGLFQGQVPNFHVARAAAQALDVFTDRVHVSAVEEVQRFLKERKPDRDDPIVHYYALQFLAGVKHQPVIELVSSYLSDDWHVPGVKHEGFPLRYVAAWGLLTHLIADKTVAEWIPMDGLYEAARHHDLRLAGPSVLCLGLCGHRASGAVMQLLRLDGLSLSRAAVLRLGLALADTDAPQGLLDLLPNHPIDTVIRLSRSTPAIDEPAWTRFVEENLVVQDWLAEIQSSEDAHPVLRLGLHELFHRRIETHLSHDDIRTGELPESLPVLNLRSMTGGE